MHIDARGNARLNTLLSQIYASESVISPYSQLFPIHLFSYCFFISSASSMSLMSETINAFVSFRYSASSGGVGFSEYPCFDNYAHQTGGVILSSEKNWATARTMRARVV
jgi:hypothetical protein